MQASPLGECVLRSWREHLSDAFCFRFCTNPVWQGYPCLLGRATETQGCQQLAQGPIAREEQSCLTPKTLDLCMSFLLLEQTATHLWPKTT